MDQDLRRLQRAAAEGDREAKLALLREKARVGEKPCHPLVESLLSAVNARPDYPLPASEVWEAIRAVASSNKLARAFRHKVSTVPERRTGPGIIPRGGGTPRNAGRSGHWADDLLAEVRDSEDADARERRSPYVSSPLENIELADTFQSRRQAGRGSYHVAALAVVTGPNSPVTVGVASAWFVEAQPSADAFWRGLSSISEPMRLKRLRDWAESRAEDRVRLARDEVAAILGL